MGTQINGAARRLVTAAAAGALVTGALSMGGVPAYAAENNLRGTVVDPKGNPVDGYLYITADGVTVASDYVTGGRIEATIPTTGDFRLRFDPSGFNGLLQSRVLPRQGDPRRGDARRRLGGHRPAVAVDDRLPAVRHGRRDRRGGGSDRGRVRAGVRRRDELGRGVRLHRGRRHLPRAGFRHGAGEDPVPRPTTSRPSGSTTSPASRPPTPSRRPRLVPTWAASCSPRARPSRVWSPATPGVPLERVYVRAIDPDTGASFNDYTNASGGYTIEGSARRLLPRPGLGLGDRRVRVGVLPGHPGPCSGHARSRREGPGRQRHQPLAGARARPSRSPEPTSPARSSTRRASPSSASTSTPTAPRPTTTTAVASRAR